MHVSRQPNIERWVQSNSPFSLVLRDRVDSKLAVAWSKLAMAWSKLLAKAMPMKSWRLRVRLTERTVRWRSRWLRAWVTWISVWGWDSEWERESVRLLCVRERVRVRESESESDLCEALFLKIPYLKSSLWDLVSLPSTWNIKDHSWNRVSETRFHFK